MMTQAYYTAAFYRTKRLPSLKKILKNIKPRKPMKPEEMLEVVKQLNAAFGGEVKHGNS